MISDNIGAQGDVSQYFREEINIGINIDVNIFIILLRCTAWPENLISHKKVHAGCGFF